ncbi:Uncharacterised protein [Metamycoplasma cloacale]|uniref:TIR domain-containing protein n=1 Tax=Metamycoplasma cloacale TaxID=92401 RepID=UPI0010051940|nr:TIR domain-containing protein [Metamycoplasma cloacale]VEU79182.1 Uncharacterised protein [Metamycoplasma cloacale]
MKKKINIFISFSHNYKNNYLCNKLQDKLNNEEYIINFSEKEDKSEYSIQTIWDYLASRIKQSSCTILLMTQDLLFENKHKISYIPNDFEHSGWIYKEISASLRDWKENRINGLVCVVEESIANWFRETVSVIEFTPFINRNYYLFPEILELNKKYIIFASYFDFFNNPSKFIKLALENRKKQINTNGEEFNIFYEPHNKK